MRLVAYRLNLCAMLTRYIVGSALFCQQEGLIMHLLLTCFDRLGQNKEWITFEAWIKNLDDRKIEETAKGATVDVILELLSKYNEEHSQRRSFHRFINTILPERIRKVLLLSFDDCQQRLDTDKKKIDFLYSIRNAYTHSLNVEPRMCSVPFGRTTNQYACTILDKALSTRNWPNVFEDAVRAGLIECLKKFLPNGGRKDKDYITLDISNLCHGKKDLWRLVYNPLLSVKDFLMKIAEGVNCQGAFREIGGLSYEVDWLIREKTGMIFEGLFNLDDKNSYEKSIASVGIRAGAELELVDKFNLIFPMSKQHIFKKHEMKDGTYRIVYYHPNGYQAVSSLKDTYQNWLQEGNRPEIVPYAKIPPAAKA